MALRELVEWLSVLNSLVACCPRGGLPPCAWKETKSFDIVHQTHCVSLAFPHLLTSYSSGWHLAIANRMACLTSDRVADATNFRMFQKASSLADLIAPQKVGITTSGCKLKRAIASVASVKINCLSPALMPMTVTD